MRGLDALDQAAPARPRGSWEARRSPEPRWLRPLRRRRDDDDDPPPCPAAALPPGVELELRRRREIDLALVAALHFDAPEAVDQCRVKQIEMSS